MSRNLIDRDAYAEEMKKRQDACKEWTQRTIDTVDEENFLRSCGAYVAFVEAKLLLENQPTVDAVEVVHGKWEKAKRHGIVVYSDAYAECSSCHSVIFLGWKMNYCPNCGAKMQNGEVKDE